jgi:hypothetical protein
VVGRALREASRLVVKVNRAKESKGDRELLVVNLSALGLPPAEPIPHIIEWFTDAHNRIVGTFENLMSDRAKEELWDKHG